MKPFLKWAGGKSRLASSLSEYLNEGRRLVEPFVGSAALFLHTDFERYLLCDTNSDLINLYNNLKNTPEELISRAKSLFSEEYSSEYRFYELREKFNSLNSKDIEKSALFIYLNKHAFNGLCRYNRKGFFNVPYGKYKAPKLPEYEMRNFSYKAKRAQFKCQDFEDTFEETKSGDVIYCDPPYVPLSATSSFTAYSKDGFNLDDQRRLLKKAIKMKSKGVQCVISNHDLSVTREMYSESTIYEIEAQRKIASKSTSRGKVRELIAVF